MNSNVTRGLSTAATLAGAVALFGCGGGGHGMSDTTPPVEPPLRPEPPARTLTVPTGMTASSAPGVTAQNAGDTIAALLPRPGQKFAPVSARSRTDEFHVKAISSDGNNGFRVTYVVAGQERTVHFEADDYGARTGSPADYYAETADGGRFWLNAFFRSFSQEAKNQGSPDFEYLDIYGSGVSGYGTLNRQRLSFGARTDAANLPAGTASYSGLVTAENHPREFESLDTRGGLWGNWRLTADFSESTLAGDIRFVRVREAGESDYRVLPFTTYFNIEDGEIVDGQFTASLAGMDSNPSAPVDRTLAGFEGDILGEFYGPRAEEAGGVLRAVRTTDNRVLFGSLSGKQMPELDPSLPEGDLSVQSVAVNRDYVATNVQPSNDAEVTTIESDGANGFHVTYRVGGTDHRVHLAEQIYFNRFDGFGLFDHQAAGLFTLRSETGSFVGTPEFSYFDVHGWAMGRYAADGALQSRLRGFVVSGVPTEAANLPAGTATYEGRAHFLGWPSDNPRLAANVRSDGLLTLNADFDTSTVGGVIDQIANPDSQISEILITNGAVQGGELTADLQAAQGSEAFDGDMTGRFYGPQAAEVGGVLQGSYTSPQVTAVVHGWFGGKKQ